VIRPTTLRNADKNVVSQLNKTFNSENSEDVTRGALDRGVLLTPTNIIGGRVNSHAGIERGCSNILAASSNACTLCDPVNLTSDPILNGGQGIVMDCVPSLAISVSAVLVLSCGQTDRQTDTQSEADQRYSCDHRRRQ